MKEIKRKEELILPLKEIVCKGIFKSSEDCNLCHIERSIFCLSVDKLAEQVKEEIYKIAGRCQGWIDFKAELDLWLENKLEK